MICRCHLETGKGAGASAARGNDQERQGRAARGRRATSVLANTTVCQSWLRAAPAAGRSAVCDFGRSVGTLHRPHLQPLEVLQRARCEALQRGGAHREGPLRAQRARAVQHKEQHLGDEGHPLVQARGREQDHLVQPVGPPQRSREQDVQHQHAAAHAVAHAHHSTVVRCCAGGIDGSSASIPAGASAAAAVGVSPGGRSAFLRSAAIFTSLFSCRRCRAAAGRACAALAAQLRPQRRLQRLDDAYLAHERHDVQRVVVHAEAPVLRLARVQRQVHGNALRGGANHAPQAALEVRGTGVGVVTRSCRRGGRGAVARAQRR